MTVPSPMLPKARRVEQAGGQLSGAPAEAGPELDEAAGDSHGGHSSERRRVKERDSPADGPR